ncbi:ABC transporter permease [Lacisediminihabitans changchengi]|uniref:ABC transporter permease n=1 Tax=Lacisediminihabitans changchengi TaxID=2787634 RepID=A0A934SGH1_9MICO|nr:ABC transporter permease [Lacisediminihabitans changchengi]MBK4346191.1 ABC transporter permease [Lacisediminihabitans changchengi]
MPIRYILLESWRQLRNVRSLAFTFVVPLVMLLIFGSIYGAAGQQEQTTGLPWLIVTTVQMASYGGMMAALSQAFAITTERSIGWNRQLRITPLSGAGYLLSKVSAALLVALTSIVLLCAVSIVALGARMDALHWLLAILGVWVGVIPFALIAVAIGQFAKPSFAQPLFMVVFLGLAVLGGLWIPLEIMPNWVIGIAQVVPSYWLNKLGQIGAHGSGDALVPIAILAAWTVVLAALITWRYRRDAARS